MLGFESLAMRLVTPTCAVIQERPGKARSFNVILLETDTACGHYFGYSTVVSKLVDYTSMAVSFVWALRTDAVEAPEEI
jgi:hypothetical protein